MKVFIAGATGVLGRRVVQLLVSGGHEVTALSRSQANTDWLNSHGAHPRPGDIFNMDQICKLVAGCEAVLHLATSIPTTSRTTLADWATNDRLRREGTRNLLEAALRDGCRRYVQEGVLFVYGDRKGEWVDERTQVDPRQGGIVQSALDMEAMIWSATVGSDLSATILRYGRFYAHDAAHTRQMFEAVRKRAYPVIGNGRTYGNNIHADDAAAAVVRVLQTPPDVASGLFNICDDEPVMDRDLLDYVAGKLEARRPLSLPRTLAGALVGTPMVNFLAASFRCRNSLARERLGWQPRYPNYRDGFVAEIQEWLDSA